MTDNILQTIILFCVPLFFFAVFAGFLPWELKKEPFPSPFEPVWSKVLGFVTFFTLVGILMSKFLVYIWSA